MKRLDRRRILFLGAAATGTTRGFHAFLAFASAASASAAPSIAVTPAIHTFGYNQSGLLEGPMRQQFVANHEFFLRLESDGLLQPFHQRAGLNARREESGSSAPEPGGSFAMLRGTVCGSAAGSACFPHEPLERPAIIPRLAQPGADNGGWKAGFHALSCHRRRAIPALS